MQKRQAHHEAIEKILSFNDKKKENDMVTMVSKKIFETLSKSLENLMKLQNANTDTDKPGFKLDEKSSNGKLYL